MTEKRQELEAALQSLATGSGEEDDQILAAIRDRTGLEDDSLKWEISALRLFSVESGIDLGSHERPSDRLLAALYRPLVALARDDSDPQASVDFADLRSRAETYRAALKHNESSVGSAGELVDQVGQQFANLCNSDDPGVSHAGAVLFARIAKQAKNIAETHAQYGLH
jgi:hypothetical protein